MIRRLLTVAACVGALAVFGLGATPSTLAQSKKMIFALPGVPPIFATVLMYVADKEGFFKKYGADVELRPFDTGTAAARAVIAGDIDFALSPSPLVITQISNADVPLVSIYGMPNPDWVLASTDAGKSTCKDITGQPVGVDAVGGARSIALRTMIATCGMKVEDVQQVALSSNTAPAMIAGRLTFGVLHLDDIAVIEAQGKKVTTILAMKKTNPTSHYMLGVARQDKLKDERDAYVRLLAGLIDATRYIQDPKNADRVAEIAAPIGHDKNISKDALKQFLDIQFWAVDNDGLDEKKLSAVAAVMKKVGSIKPEKEAAAYERIVDRSVWKDAMAMVNSKK
jgi:NitT/TauT family transport system substrate-binding protein